MLKSRTNKGLRNLTNLKGEDESIDIYGEDDSNYWWILGWFRKDNNGRLLPIKVIIIMA